MTNAEKREAARQFVNKWRGRGKEDEDDRSFWFELLMNVMGQNNVTDRVEFQKKVVGPDGNTKRIDAYIPETKVIIEQKSLGIDLSKPQTGHEGMTPYEQAKMYDNGLPVSEKARWIVTSNFSEFRIYDMNTRKPVESEIIIQLNELPDKLPLLDFLVKEEVKKITEEVELSIKAGELVGKIHDRFLEQYNDPMAKKTQNSLNILCVRLVFCLYAEDAGLFGEHDAFKKYLEQFEPQHIRRALLDLFKVLNTPENDREELYLDDELAAFPYCNGGLFERENIEIPKITQDIKDTLIDASRFDWSKISPTIFGAVFESTLNPETRHDGGMHYTSVENIHKVIDPLFLDDLKYELDNILIIPVQKTRDSKLRSYQDKLASLKFLDPAAGSGNFLTETYISLRRLENKVISALNNGQISWGFADTSQIKVSIDQFYGIEINDFAVTVAKAALWIAESQMMIETEDVIQMHLDFLPLKTNATIVEGNALRIDWRKIVKPSDLSYIMGNPPFLGASNMNKEQKAEVFEVFKGLKKAGDLDYVTAWYKKACEYCFNTKIEFAFVSTNSICQGEQPIVLWRYLQEEYGAHIRFGYESFIWNSEANDKAHVHCVIVGVTFSSNYSAVLFSQNGMRKECSNINGYLIDADDVYIESFTKPLCDIPKMIRGSSPCDNGNYSFTQEEKDIFVKNNPSLEKYIKEYIGSREFINKIPRYCLWLYGANPTDIKQSSDLKTLSDNVAEFRRSSKKPQTRQLAETPLLWEANRYNGEDFILIPRVSSQNRRYIPMGFISGSVVANDAAQLVPNATIYQFGVLTSNVHMSWMRTTAGRLKSDYRYSNLVYNSFPWPTPTAQQKECIEKTAQAILDARALYPDSSLADLYDPVAMPPELRKAHTNNDIAVMKSYGFDIKNTSEEDCVAHLMRMYQELTEK